MGHRILRSARKPSNLIRDPELRSQRREEVGAAALDLFMQEGFHSTGVRQIALRAGISPGAVLTYFKDKEEILFYLIDKEQGVMEEAVANIVAQVRPTISDGMGAQEALALVLDTYLRAVDQVARFTLLAYQETKSLRPAWREGLLARERRIQKLFVEVIGCGVQQGVFSPEHLAVKAHSIMMLAQTWAVRRWALKEIDSIEEYIAIMKPLVLGMLTGGIEQTAKRDHGRAKETRLQVA
ncbi:MAG: TetR/AcrR family transcriptional regulator [Candidatus Binatia bacterium]